MIKKRDKKTKTSTTLPIEILSVYLDDQKRILSRRTNELPIKYQRRLTKEIKRARIIGLLPFTIEAEY